SPRVVVPKGVIVAGQLDKARVGQMLGEPTPVADVDEAVVHAMKDQRGYVDAGNHVAYVDFEKHLDERPEHSGAGAAAPQPSKKRPALGIVRLAGRGDLDDRALAPVWPDELDA